MNEPTSYFLASSQSPHQPVEDVIADERSGRLRNGSFDPLVIECVDYSLDRQRREVGRGPPQGDRLVDRLDSQIVRDARIVKLVPLI